MADITCRKRGDKWYYSFEAAQVDGKRKRVERVGGRTKKEALEKGIQALNEYNNSGMHFEPSQVSVADFLDYYVDNFSKINNRYNTQVRHVGIIETYLKPQFGMYKLCNLSTGPIQEFVNTQFVNGKAKSTVQNIVGALSQAYEFAISLSYVKDNPCKRVKYSVDFKKPETRDVIPLEEYNRIIEEFADKPHFRIAIMIGWYAGLRISETYALTWNDIDFDNKTISITKQTVKRNFGVDVRRSYLVKGKKEERSSWYFAQPKTKSSVRTILVSDVLLAELKKMKVQQMENRMYYGEYYTNLYLKDEKDEKGQTIKRIIPIEASIPCALPSADLLFRKENGDYSSTDSFKFAARVIHHKLGYSEFDYHSLRHTHATMLIEAGASPKSVQERLGHKDITTTFNRYVHDTQEMEQEAVDIFDSAMHRKQG